MGQDHPDPGRRFRFAHWAFDPVTGDLSSAKGSRVRLAPKPARLLTLLLENAGELVSRETLTDALWPATIVEFDKNLNFCMRQVRAALGDDAANPLYIQTLPRRGYRFICPVDAIEGETTSPPESARAVPHLRRRAGAALALAATGMAVVTTLHLARPGVGSHDAPDPRAREALEMGGYLLRQAGDAELERSVGFFREALSLDPTLAPAYAGLGVAYLRLSRPRAGTAALRRALELDPGQWPSHLRLGLHALHVDHDLEGAVDHLLQAQALAPDEASVLHSLAWLTAVVSGPEPGIGLLRDALRIDPVSPRVNGDTGRMFYLAGRTEEAVAHCSRTSELVPDRSEPRDCLIHALVEQGSHERAREEAVALLRILGASPAVVDSVRSGDAPRSLGAYWAWAGYHMEARATENPDHHVRAAAAWARSGEPERAFGALQEAYRARSPMLLQLPRDPAFRVLSDDPRFAALVRRLGLPAPPDLAQRLEGAQPAR